MMGRNKFYLVARALTPAENSRRNECSDTSDDRPALDRHMRLEPPPRGCHASCVSGDENASREEKHDCERAEDDMNHDQRVIIGGGSFIAGLD